MKFCPECGSIIEDKKTCQCGYDVEKGKVDENIRKQYEDNQKKFAKEIQANNIIPNTYIDEIPMNFKDDIFKDIYMELTYYIKDITKNNFEERLYNIYISRGYSKEKFINKLNIILKKELDNKIKKVIEKIEKEEE